MISTLIRLDILQFLIDKGGPELKFKLFIDSHLVFEGHYLEPERGEQVGGCGGELWL